MPEVTSLFDYFNKCEQNKLYKRAAIMAYRYNYKKVISFIEAKKWIDKWAKNAVKNEAKGTGYEPTCRSMSEFLNRFIVKMNKASITRKVTIEINNRLRRMEVGVLPPAAEPRAQ